MLEVDIKDIIHCASHLEISSKCPQDLLSHNSIIKEMVRELHFALLADLEAGLFDKPFIIFEDDPSSDLKERIELLCKEGGVPCVTVGDEETALSMQIQYRPADKGCFFILQKFMRGIDLKFKVGKCDEPIADVPLY